MFANLGLFANVSKYWLIWLWWWSWWRLRWQFWLWWQLWLRWQLWRSWQWWLQWQWLGNNCSFQTFSFGGLVSALWRLLMISYLIILTILRFMIDVINDDNENMMRIIHCCFFWCWCWCWCLCAGVRGKGVFTLKSNITSSKILRMVQNQNSAKVVYIMI